MVPPRGELHKTCPHIIRTTIKVDIVFDNSALCIAAA